jgi:accessory gene regulator B
MNIAVLVIIRLFSSVEPVFSTLAAAGSLAVFILAPVGTRNKPLDKTERLVYRQKTIMLLAAELIIYLVLLFFHLKETAAAAAMALLALGFMLVMGSIKLYHEKHTAGKQIR